jgi:hypothetical protein
LGVVAACFEALSHNALDLPLSARIGRHLHRDLRNASE